MEDYQYTAFASQSTPTLVQRRKPSRIHFPTAANAATTTVAAARDVTSAMLSTSSLFQPDRDSSTPDSLSPAHPGAHFALNRVQFTWRSDLTALQCRNNQLVMGIREGRVLRIDLMHPQRVEEIELGVQSPAAVTGKSTAAPSETWHADRMHRLHLDYTGKHCLVSMRSGANFYLHSSWKKARPLTRLRSLLMECVAWSRPPSTALLPSKVGARIGPGCTGPLLFGTRDGNVYEMNVDAQDDFFSRKEERYLKLVYSLPQQDHRSRCITGLYFDRMVDESEDFGSLQKYFVIMTTLDCVYQFLGPVDWNWDASDSVFEKLFAKYPQATAFQELPGLLDYGEFRIRHANDEGDEGLGAPFLFSWLTTPGIYYGDLVTFTELPRDSVLENTHLLPYVEQAGNPKIGPEFLCSSYPVDPESQNHPAPLSMACTRFHIILLYRDRVRIICRLNDEMVWEAMIPDQTTGHWLMAVDEVKETFWVFSERVLYELVITEEDYNIWSLYLAKKQFDAALEYCKHPWQKNAVYEAQGHHYFDQGRFLLAAKCFSQSAIPLEDVVMAFQFDAPERLAQLSREAKSNPLPEAESITSEGSYDVDDVRLVSQDALRIYLMQKMKRLKEEDATQRSLLSTWILELFMKKITQYRKQRREKLQDVEKEYGDWMTKSIVDILPNPVAYTIFANNNCDKEMIEFSLTKGDYDRVLSHYARIQDWEQLLQVLRKQTSVDNYYRYAPMLIQHAPYETVSLWVQISYLNPKFLIPALLKYQSTKSNGGVQHHQAIRYLEFCVRKLRNTDETVHNYLLSLYVNECENEEVLVNFVKSPYALRLCVQKKRLHASVVLFGELGLFDEAVEFALSHHDLELARIYASKPDDTLTKKKLWLQIARFLAFDKKDITAVVKLVRETSELEIEDVLPFFPDFVLIKDFKDEICETLIRFKEQIEELTTDMDDASKSADAIRLDLRKLKKQYVLHENTLTTFRQRVLQLQEGIAKQESETDATHRFSSGYASDLTANDPSTTGLRSRGEQSLQRQLDDLIGSECAFCGELIIKSIDKPLVDFRDTIEIRSWAI